MWKLRTFIRVILIINLLLCVTNGKKNRHSRKRHAKTSTDDNSLAPSLETRNLKGYIELFGVVEEAGVTRIDESTWKFRTRSTPIQVNTVSTAKVLNSMNGSLSISMEIRVGSKKVATVFRSYSSNFTQKGPITWVEIIFDSENNFIIVKHRTPTLVESSAVFKLTDNGKRSWIKLLVAFRTGTDLSGDMVLCQHTCEDSNTKTSLDGINLVFPKDMKIEFGGNNNNPENSFIGQIRNPRVYIPPIFTYPWECRNSAPASRAKSKHKKRGLPPGDPMSIPQRPKIVSASFDVGNEYDEVLEELRTEIQSCKSENIQMNTMMQMMKQMQSSLESRIAALESCECIPMCVTRSGVKRRHGEVWQPNTCGNCECRNGEILCEKRDGCETETNACLSNPCVNNGACEEVDDSYICRCRRGFRGKHCEFTDQCALGICENGADCELLETGRYRCQCKNGFSGINCEQPAKNHCQSYPCRNNGSCINTSVGYICNCLGGFKGRQCEDFDACFSNPCLNNGLCTTFSERGYTCRCRSKFYGTNCELRNSCYSSPCLNGGRCLRRLSSYTCDCVGPYHGTHCELKDVCYTNPCLNRGRCLTDSRDSSRFTCECLDGFKGTKCEFEDICYSSPCLNAGRCLPSSDFRSYTCDCEEPYHGSHCELQDSCHINPCLNEGRCTKGSSNGVSFTCECLDGFIGTKCELRDLCYSSPCRNKGRCIPSSDFRRYSCACVEPFHGSYCELTDSCRINPCLNGGQCVRDSLDRTAYACDCPDGFSGGRCEDEDACFSEPCLNGGRCTNIATGGNKFTCVCIDSYVGLTCEHRDSCYSSPCLNGGLCENRQDGFFCRCRATHYGDRCETTDYCRARACRNGASCTNKPSKYGKPYTCECTNLFVGEYCEYEDLCKRSPCLNGGVCSMEDGNFVCKCQDSYFGRRCELTDYCSRNPCLNGGRCENRDSGSGFLCTCPTSHIGNRCQKPHPCRPNPCLNNGRCQLVGEGSYSCECPPSHRGPTCRLNNHCRRNPCRNGGTCLNDGDTYTCDCLDGYSGSNCEEVDFCGSNPCQNGGECVEERGTYKCICSPPFVGGKCQYSHNVCAYKKQVGNCEEDDSRWYFDKYTQKCQEFKYSGCGGNGNNFISRQACRQKCLVGACCMLRHSMIHINGHADTPPSFNCQTLTIGQCKRMDTQHNELQVLSFNPGVGCSEVSCGSQSTCSFGGKEYNLNSIINIGCEHSCACRRDGNIRCRCEEKSQRREIRELSTAERETYQNAIRTLKMKEVENDQTVWDLMRDEYIKKFPTAQSPRYFLLWNRAFLRKMELLLQSIDCDIAIPYYDFTQDTGKLNDAIIWQPNFFGGDGNCVPDHPFRVSKNGEASAWEPCLSRNFSSSVNIPCMLDVATVLNSKTYEQLSGKLMNLVSYINAFIGGDMATSMKAYDPLFYTVHAFVDYLFLTWQKMHPGNEELKHIQDIQNVPLGMHIDDLWDGACVEYGGKNPNIACNRSDVSEESFGSDGYNLQGYNRQGFNRDGFNKDGYNAIGQDVYGRLDKRGLFKYDGYNAEGYARTGYDRRGFDKFGFNKKGRNRCNINAGGFDPLGFNRYGLDDQGYDRRGFDVYGRNRFGNVDNSELYDRETGFNDCCFGRDGLTPTGLDRFGFDIEGYDSDICNHHFNGPYSISIRNKLWEMLSPQKTSFLSTIARTCGSLKALPRKQISLNWANNPAYSLSSRQSGKLSPGKSNIEKTNKVFSERFCFDVDMLLTWCPCLEKNYPAICSTNPCLNTHCPLHPNARCVINMCGRSCTADFYQDGRRVNCENPCSPNPCQNGGTCEPSRYSSASERFQCHCPDEYVGQLCEKPAPDTCMLSKAVGTCQSSVNRYFYNFKTAACEAFIYSGCGGNSNNFPSKRACDLRCALGACCYRLPRNSTFNIGFDRDGFDRYGFNALGYNRRGQQQSSHDSLPTGNRIFPPKGFGPDGYDVYGYDVDGYNRQGYNRAGFHRDTGFNRTGFNPDGEFDQLMEFGYDGYNRSGLDRAGYTCNGIDKEGFNQLGLYYDFEYRCQSLLLVECEALKDPDQLGIPFEVISFAPGNTCDEIQCGEECGCTIDGKLHRFGETFQKGCESCTCTLGGVVECTCQRLGRRREIRDLTQDEREEYGAAIRSLYKSGKWEEFATQHAQHMPKSNGVASSLPWHRYFLRMVEQEIQKQSSCEVFIPYFDWTIDVGNLENSQIWQTSFFGGNGEEISNCVHHHPFNREVRWHPCIKRQFDKSVSLPNAVNFHLLLHEENYDKFRFQLEMMSALFHVWVGGHMASPFSPYDPIYLSHWAFMDYIWNRWQENNPMGITRFPSQHRYVRMMPFLASPDDVLSSELQMCVIYIPPTIGSPCNRTKQVGLPPLGRDSQGLDRHGFDDRGFDVHGFNIKGIDRSGRPDTRNLYDKSGYDVQGYQRSGFDSSDWDRYNFNTYNFNRDGFDIENFDESGYDRYGFDRDGKTPFGLFRNMSFAPGFDQGYGASLFDRYGYNQYGYDKNGFDHKGFDAFGFNNKRLDLDNCDYYFYGPHYMRYFYHVKEQLSVLNKDMLKNIKRICPPITPLPEFWASHIWMDKMSLGRNFETMWKEDHEIDEAWEPRKSSVTEELLWLPITPDWQFCFEMNWFSGCPLGTQLLDCKEDKCARSSCASHPTAQCRMKNCGACYPEFYNGKTGEIYQCYGCVSNSGETQNEGSTWHDGCDTCVCQAGLISCSPMACPSHACTHPAPGQDGCCDVCDNCEYENRIYRNGITFKPNECQSCECIDGSVMCHDTVTNCEPVKCAQPVKLPGECCPTCSTECREHKALESWAMDKCHNCSCVADRIICSRNQCPVLQCSHPRTGAGDCCPKCMGCEYKGKNYRHQQNFMIDSCSQCKCRFGNVMCTTQQCPPLNCKHKEKPPGSCCLRCRKGCEYEGIFYDNGVSFKTQNNPCLNCTCLNGQPSCIRQTCERVSCSRPVVPEGECCPRCATCQVGSTVFSEGQMWTSRDRCKKCVCQAGEQICRKIIPCRSDCSNGVVHRGQCCPDCSQCSYHGKIFQHLEPFSDPYDACQRCSCQSGNVICSTTVCPEVTCRVLETPVGECCPQCKSCVYEGALREHGSSWKISQDPCTTCSCVEGTIDCFDEYCPAARCDYPSTPPGTCCPTCNGCSYRGQNYDNGEMAEPESSCSTCQCMKGNVICRENPCPSIQCRNPVKKLGDCCPSCATCEYDGQTYDDEAVFVPVRDPCRNCTCMGGRVNCDRLDLSCKRMLCSHPGRTRSQCCLSCDSCEYERRNYNNGTTFTPSSSSPCLTCTCLSGTVTCEMKKCSSISCTNPVRKPGSCCATCEDCVTNGRRYSNGERWKSDSCTNCECSFGSVQCHPVSCSTVSCSHPFKPPNRCCPTCNKCLYNGETYSDGQEFHSLTDRCHKCTCMSGTVSCIRRSCPELECENQVLLTGACCRSCSLDCELLGISILNGQSVEHPRENCKQCTCTDGTVKCRRHRCTRDVGCSHPSTIPGGCCRDACGDCKYRGSIVRNGESVRQTTDFCRICTCNDGNIVCIRERCKAPTCENPNKPDGKCCLECPGLLRSCQFRGEEMLHGKQFKHGCQVCSCSDGVISCRPVKCSSVSCAMPVRVGCCFSCNHGCYIDGVKYKNNQVVKKQNGGLCNECQCMDGDVTCKKRKCEPVDCTHPSDDECCPTCNGCRYGENNYDDGTSFQDPDDKCNICTCDEGSIHCTQKQCRIPCTHPLDPDDSSCCPKCGEDCLLDEKLYKQTDGMFILPSDKHGCRLCVCDAGSIVCKDKPCPKVNCRNPVVNECGCPICTGCLYNGISRSNKETFANPENEKCSDCYCSNGNVICGKRSCPVSSCTHPVKDDCDCPHCDKCLYGSVTYNHGDVFGDLEDRCNSCECQDGNVVCESQTCAAVSCTHPSTNECGCRTCASCSYGGVDHEEQDRFTDPANKCNECVCQSGTVTCTRVRCEPTPCANPILSDGECCAKCLGTCHVEGQTYEDGATFTLDSDPCSKCSCSSGNIRCVRQRCDVRCVNPVAQSQCCPDCSACLYQGIRREEGEFFIPKDNNCKQCSCHRGNIICKFKECPKPACDNPQPVRGSCCPTCPQQQTSECVVDGKSQKPGTKWIQDDYDGICQECTCLESGTTSCSAENCGDHCSHPVPRLDSCCPSCAGPCYYNNHTYNSGTMFHPNECKDCLCTGGNVNCVMKSCPTLTCPASKQIKKSGDCCTRCKSCVMGGKIHSDHDSWTLPEDPCQECQCLNGVVTCAQIQCLQPCRMMITIPGQCCPVCAGCFYNNKVYQIGETFEPNSMDSCEICECKASPTRAPIMSCKRKECPSLADCPRSCIRQPLPGQCCPTCTNRPECAYGLCSAESQGSRIVPNENRCYSCDCQMENTWVCLREQCKILDCPVMKRYTPNGACCPVCDECHLDMENLDVPNGKVWKRSECEVCRCDKGSIICVKQDCPMMTLKCSAGTIPYKKAGQCCHECLNADAPCTYEGQSIQAHHKWKSDQCTTCTCFGGEVNCVTEKCRMVMCHADHAPTVISGECCPKCMPRPASCTAFGDPHYKTFDGRMVHFQGTCQYLLTADCSKSDFKVIVHNTRNIGSSRKVSWTEQVTIITAGGTVSLMKDYSIRINGTVVRHLPFSLLPYYYIEVVGNYMLLKTHLGVHLSWNGRQQRLEVTVPGTYKRRTCGLCGNFNNYPQDDRRLHNSRLATSDSEFGNDWKINIPNAPPCPDVEDHNPCNAVNYAMRTLANEKCKILNSPTFAACHAVVNPAVYFATCVYDLCACGESEQSCLCDVLEAYAAQCSRSGIAVRWRNPALCAVVCPYDRGYVFDECGSPCKRTCANRNLPPGSIAAQCYLPCVSGCQCPAGKVEYGRRCIYPEMCPAELLSTIEDPMIAGVQHANRPLPTVSARVNRHSALVRPPLVAPPHMVPRG
uniref:uncharacterized protein LOC120330882 isoform X1 n=1 Tax=Styela clava TaxID=7725 RepID=UPI00193A036A|nr:uncharacterized protein LOC120330882 isoform X1 [Styela clava]